MNHQINMQKFTKKFATFFRHPPLISLWEERFFVQRDFFLLETKFSLLQKNFSLLEKSV